MRSETRHVPVGLTPDAGWALTVRRTLPSPAEVIWQRLLTEWLPEWLEVDSVPQMVGARLRCADGASGRVVGCHVGRRITVRWMPESLDHETVFQVTLQEPFEEALLGTELEIHQERLLGAAERASLLVHWTAVLDALTLAFARESAVDQDLPG